LLMQRQKRTEYWLQQKQPLRRKPSPALRASWPRKSRQ